MIDLIIHHLDNSVPNNPEVTGFSIVRHLRDNIEIDYTSP